MEKITFIQDDGEEAAFYVLEQTKIGEVNYILVVDTMEEGAEALIMRETAGTQGAEMVYEIVGEDTELNAVAAVFANLLGDIEFTDGN